MNDKETAGNTDDISAVIENLDIAESRTLPCLLSISAHLRELARTLTARTLAGSGETRETIQRFLSGFPANRPKHNDRFVDYSVSKLDFFERMQLFSYLSKNQDIINILDSELLNPHPDSVLPSASGKIAYIKNNYSDAAYMKFSAVIKSPRAVYFTNFQGICEEVYNGICEYCIIPVESSEDGRLNNFCSLISKYELKIRAVCDIPLGADGVGGFTRYTLLARNILQLSHPDIKDGGIGNGYIFEIGIMCEGYPTISDIINASQICGLNILSIYTSHNADKCPVYSLIFSTDGADLMTFLLFLSFDAPHCVPTGLYKFVKDGSRK